LTELQRNAPQPLDLASLPATEANDDLEPHPIAELTAPALDRPVAIDDAPAAVATRLFTAPTTNAMLPAMTTAQTPTPQPWPPRRARNGFQLAVHLARRPGFCCCCWRLGPEDTKRAKRIFALVRAIKRAEKAERRREQQRQQEHEAQDQGSGQGPQLFSHVVCGPHDARIECG
jgi:hypothetical protein